MDINEYGTDDRADIYEIVQAFGIAFTIVIVIISIVLIICKETGLLFDKNKYTIMDAVTLAMQTSESVDAELVIDNILYSMQIKYRSSQNDDNTIESYLQEFSDGADRFDSWSKEYYTSAYKEYSSEGNNQSLIEWTSVYDITRDGGILVIVYCIKDYDDNFLIEDNTMMFDDYNNVISKQLLSNGYIGG